MIGFWMAFLGVIASMGLIWSAWAGLRLLLERMGWSEDPALSATLLLLLLLFAAVIAMGISNIGDPR